MRVAFIIPSATPDHAPLFREIANIRKELDLTVYFFSDAGVGKSEYDPRFGVSIQWDVPLLEGYVYRFLKNFSPFKNPEKFFGLINLGIVGELRRKKYDAVLIDGYTSCSHWLAFLGAWISRTPIIFRGETDLTNKRGILKSILKNIILRPLFKNIDAFLYSCTPNKQYYRHYGVPEEKLFFYPCAVDNNHWREMARRYEGKKKELKEKIGVDPTSMLVLRVAHLAAWKRPADLLKAHEALILKGLNISLAFVGTGEEMENLKKYTKEKNIRNVFFLGFKNQSELPEIYATGDVLVVSSEHDRSPKAMNEGMNFSMPVIVTDTVGTGPDMVRDGENGFIYPTGNIKLLEERLAQLVRDPKLRESMGRESFSIVSQWNFRGDIDGFLAAAKFAERQKNEKTKK